MIKLVIMPNGRSRAGFFASSAVGEETKCGAAEHTGKIATLIATMTAFTELDSRVPRIRSAIRESRRRVPMTVRPRDRQIETEHVDDVGENPDQPTLTVDDATPVKTKIPCR